MSLRDIVLFVIVFGGVPFMLRHPYVGVLYWVWLGVMNPHRLTWGMAYEFPFSYLVAVTTLIGVFVTSDERRMKGGVVTALLITFTIWMSITTLFAFHPELAKDMWERVIKIQFMVLISLLVLNSRRHIDLLVWVLVVSLGYYGVKGGLFTFRLGGEFRVWGPEGSFIEDNNSLALALVMSIPLMFYLFQISTNKWVRRALLAGMVLSAAGALGSQSRGALLAIGAMSLFLWIKSPGKILSGALMFAVGIGLLSFMPDSWWNRMGTITTYQQDSSAMGRINAWYNAFNIAKDRVMGGGFELYTSDVFAKYAPDPLDVHAAHSNYFQVLGEHGFIGLAIFLVLWILVWRIATWIKKNAAGDERWRWANRLASMIQVSLVGYAVGGAFLNLAYWDLPYYELVILVVVRDIMRRETEKQRVPSKDQLSGRVKRLSKAT